MTPEALAYAADFRFGAPELKAIAIAIVIITTWAAIRYRRRAAPLDAP